VRALTDAQHDDFPARRAYLGRRLTILAVALDLNSDIVDRTEAPDIAGEVQYAAIILAVCLAGTAADLLHVEAGRACRAQHRDYIDLRHIEAVRENHHADECGQSSGTEVFDEAIALIVRGLTQHHLAIDTANAKFVTYHLGVFDSDAVDEPSTAVSEINGDLVAGTLDHVATDRRRPELIGDELAAAFADTGNIDHRGGRLR